MLKIAFDNIYMHKLKENHRFPMIKYELIPEQLVMENTCNEENFFVPKSVTDKNVLLTHDKIYYDNLVNLNLSKKEARAIGFPLSQELIAREKKIVQGTIDCTNYSLDYGISMNIAGGTHHAFTDRAEAFCMLNDQAIAANYLLNNKLSKKIMIIDLDVHKGMVQLKFFKETKMFLQFLFMEKKIIHLEKKKAIMIMLLKIIQLIKNT